MPDLTQQLATLTAQAATVPPEQVPGLLGRVRVEPGMLFTVEDLAALFGRHKATIPRACERGELPQPMWLFGKHWWTGEALAQHFRELHAHAAAQRHEDLRKAQLSATLAPSRPQPEPRASGGLLPEAALKKSL